MHKASLLGCFLSTTGRPLLLLQLRHSVMSPQRLSSFSMNGNISAFLSIIRRVPTYSKCVRTRSNASAACAAAANRSTTGAGVPARTMIENQLWVPTPAADGAHDRRNPTSAMP